MTNDRQPTLLIVDDIPENITTLAGILRDSYRVIFATNGPDAFEVLKQQDVDLILLDIMMPEMDGYEVCRCLKADSLTREIPVIFVTAMGESSDETHGLEVGAVDYLSKPCHPGIVRLRVQLHLERHNQHLALERLVRERTAELESANALLQEERQWAIETEKMASLGRMVAGFAHEINTPIGVAVGSVSHNDETLERIDRMLSMEEVSEDMLRGELAVLKESGALALANLRRAAHQPLQAVGENGGGDLGENAALVGDDDADADFEQLVGAGGHGFNVLTNRQGVDGPGIAGINNGDGASQHSARGSRPTGFGNRDGLRRSDLVSTVKIDGAWICRVDGILQKDGLTRVNQVIARPRGCAIGQVTIAPDEG